MNKQELFDKLVILIGESPWSITIQEEWWKYDHTQTKLEVYYTVSLVLSPEIGEEIFSAWRIKEEAFDACYSFLKQQFESFYNES